MDVHFVQRVRLSQYYTYMIILQKIVPVQISDDWVYAQTVEKVFTIESLTRLSGRGDALMKVGLVPGQELEELLF